MQRLVNGNWQDCTENDLAEDEQYRISVGQGGWEQKAYSSVVPTPPVIRKITKRAFMQRFTQAERIAIRASTDDIVIDIHEDLKATNSVELDLADTVNALAYLVSVAILTSDRPAEILADGTQGEV